MEGRVEFGVLGPLEVVVDGRPVPLPAGKHRVLLAALLLRANQVVSMSELIEYLWGDSPPVRARGTVHTYLTRVRGALRPAELINTHQDGYSITIRPGCLDLYRFREFVDQADKAAVEGDLAEQSERLRQALGVWRGPALSDVPSESMRTLASLPLDEERLQVLERQLDVDLALGRHAELVARLRALTAEHPLREGLWRQLMLALHGSGRQADALEAFRRLRRLLRDDLGIEPGEELQQLNRDLLTGKAPLRLAPTTVPSAGLAPLVQTGWKRQCQLPLDVATYVGRADLTKEVVGLLTADRGTVPVVAVCGPPGVGKTAFAVRVAHQVRDAFPDGQWYVRLGGVGSAARDVSEVAAELLHASGVDPVHVPDSADARVARLRARLADRSVLLVLDDAADATQVRRLLPGTAGCAVLVTSRADLRGLTALHDAYSLTLDVLPADEASALLAALVGPGLDRETRSEVARLCGHLPLALRLAAANLAGRSEEQVERYRADLRAGDRLAHLSVAGDADAAVRATFDRSYAALPPPARRLFRLLGLVPGPDISAEGAAAMLGVPRAQADVQLTRLSVLHLVRQPGPGRYRFHDLLRLYAAERAAEDETAVERRAAMHRLFQHYLRIAEDAGIPSYQDTNPVPNPATEARPLPFGPVADPDTNTVAPPAAEAWPLPYGAVADAQRRLDAELANLVAAVTYAATDGSDLHAYAWRLTAALRGYLLSRSTTAQWRAAASRPDDVAAQAPVQMSPGRRHPNRPGAGPSRVHSEWRSLLPRVGADGKRPGGRRCSC